MSTWDLAHAKRPSYQPNDIVPGVKPTDPASFGGGALLLAATAVLACYIPALRAIRVGPMVAPRNE